MSSTRTTLSKAFFRSRLAMLGVYGVLAIIACAFISNFLGDAKQPLLLAPSLHHFFGTDADGHDVATLILCGARGALLLGFFSAILTAATGLFVGALGGFFGGRLDSFLTRLVEVFLSLPTILAVLAMRGILRDPSLTELAILIGLLRWTDVARLVRAEVLRARTSDWAVAAYAMGFSELRILVRHVLPEAIGPVLISIPFAISAAITIETSMTAVGVGTNDAAASWGNLLAQALVHHDAWWLGVFPGLALLIATASFNLIGESLRDAFDPKERSMSYTAEPEAAPTINRVSMP